MQLSAAQRDRARGVLLGTAAGDALGAGYEFGPPLPDRAHVEMKGGGSPGWEPGEWTDDTSMAVAIAEVAAAGASLLSPAAQDQVVARWAGWAQSARDVGIQTGDVLAAVRRAHGGEGGGADDALAAARELHERTGRTAGNGSLMRTAPVALAFLDDPEALTVAAMRLSALTHFDPEAGEACVLWCHAIRHAVLTGEIDARAAVARVPSSRQGLWARRLEEAERSRPRDFPRNGWVVEALQAAWSAIATTPVPGGDPAAGSSRASHLRLALEAAVRGGRDADTVAAIAGGLLWAAWGASAVPAQWAAILHGWPGMDAQGLSALAAAIAGAC
jgi:ADP-ribosylglycohydrolase